MYRKNNTERSANYEIGNSYRRGRRGKNDCRTLVAPQEIRLQRHKTENRLQQKASKRDLEFSTNLLLKEDKNYRLVSNDGEITFDNYIKIDNSNIAPDEVAKMIKDRFSL